MTVFLVSRRRAVVCDADLTGVRFSTSNNPSVTEWTDPKVKQLKRGLYYPS